MGALRVLVGVDGSPGSEVALRWALREAALWSAARIDGGHDGGAPIVTSLLSWTTQEPFGGVLRAATTSDSETLAQAGRRRLERSIERVGGAVPSVDLHRLVVPGEPVSALVEAAGGADMIVVGRHRHGPFRRVNIGCVTQGVVYHAPVPVVVTRPAGDSDDDDGLAGRLDDDRRAVVVGVDGSELSLVALRWAAQAAAIRQVPLRVLHAWAAMTRCMQTCLPPRRIRWPGRPTRSSIRR